VIGRIVEIAEDGRYLSVERGFLVVSHQGNEIGRVPIDDVMAVIGNAHGLTYSNNLLVDLAHRNAPLVICAQNHSPVAVLWPLEGNYEQSARMDAQIVATRPMCKRLWAILVKHKITMQAVVLKAAGKPHVPVAALIKKVRSGDPGNIEAQAARRYWPLLFGDEFRRDRNAGGLNGMLNYGYTVLRAATARSVIAAGLHPGIALHHGNAQNPMRLVDDLIEPFRPVIDMAVFDLVGRGATEVTPDTKRTLVYALYRDMEMAQGRSPVSVCLQRLAVSLAQVFLGETNALDLPEPILLEASSENARNAFGVSSDVDDRDVRPAGSGRQRPQGRDRIS
jgi:CRISPR-associated protein Cas1